MPLPQDPVLLMSVLNTRLRDQYPSLEALCDDLEESAAALCAQLEAAGYHYDAAKNQFVP